MMPSEVSIAGADQGRELTVEELKRELAEAREQQTATSQILRAISSSPTDARRVFAEIAASAARLCDAYYVDLIQVADGHLRNLAHHGQIAGTTTLPLTRGIVSARAVLDGQTIQITDLQAATDEYPEGANLPDASVTVLR
jgi:two-component system, NtrC family, sensor kinase